MAEPLEAPQSPSQPPRPGRSRRWIPWVVGFALILLIPLIGQAGYLVGKHYSPAALWDPLWVRAYVDPPLDV
ncbi:MAG: hypothetical protein JWN15_4229, partial [Firmicutes bacterium]|nr:hypothetical protein [Bacillota bacterium]